ncbi:hypothetical protein P8936_06455 [Edaphobacter paludis]|uniref:Uncharacterized protein n=1 Tax=Edaphobacter paludis TaxID=3035702 RepID=A0AAU7DC32_9BACT
MAERLVEFIAVIPYEGSLRRSIEWDQGRQVAFVDRVSIHGASSQNRQ